LDLVVDGERMVLAYHDMREDPTNSYGETLEVRFDISYHGKLRISI
jgi:hypothetical protein